MRLLLTIMLIHYAPSGWGYDNSCCGNIHCFPVACDQLIEQPDGSWLYLPTGNMFYAMQVHPSGDKNCHVCRGDDGRSLCAYVQQGA